MLERLQKIIARAGIASRRHAEELIASGLVTVNGQTVTELGSKADASRDHIKVSGKLLRPAAERVYLLLNKPQEVVSTMSDPEGRPSLRDFLHGVPERVFPVGRLEYHSTGLVLLTNDGDLANRILQSDNLRQTYQLKLKTLLTFAEIEKPSRATGARISRLKGKEMPWYEVTLSEARRDALRNKLFQTRPSRRKNQARRNRQSEARIASFRTAPRTLERRDRHSHPYARWQGDGSRPTTSALAPDRQSRPGFQLARTAISRSGRRRPTGRSSERIGRLAPSTRPARRRRLADSRGAPQAQKPGGAKSFGRIPASAILPD